MYELANHTRLGKSIPVGLTPRQRDVLLGLIHGRAEKQIASDLNISVHTVHIYIKGVYEHYHVHTRTELFSECIVRLLHIYELEDQGDTRAVEDDATELATV